MLPVRSVLEPARPGISPLGWSGRRLGAGAGGERLLAGLGGVRTRRVVPSSLAGRSGGPGERQPPAAGRGRGWRDLCPPAQPLPGAGGATAPRWLRVRFLLFIYSRNLALPSLVMQGIVARARVQKRALANAQIRQLNAYIIFALQDLQQLLCILLNSL